MKETPTCFVIIGFGKKTSYANGKLRVLDLDETYSLLIKPVFEALGIPCYRAIDKNLSGSIDRLMLQEIRHADIALVDISTLNPNVMWELGVRHALKPRHTVMICEKEQMSSIPFDINHFVVHQYVHTEEGIPAKEVPRFTAHLKGVIEGILKQPADETDSPVFTFLGTEAQGKSSEEQQTKETGDTGAINEETLADLLEKGEKAKKQNDFLSALRYFKQARERAKDSMTLKDSLSFIIARQALCTYKSKVPNELEALVSAKLILDELRPGESQDVEVLGLTGAIHKRLYELTADASYLDPAILAYERGFVLKQDYYNGINAAFMLYKKAWLLRTQHKDFEDVKLKADYIRASVLDIGLKLQQQPDFSDRPDALWILLTIAEAYHYKGQTDNMLEYEAKASRMAEERKDSFALSSYLEQKAKIEAIK